MTNERLCAALRQGDRSALDALIEQNMAFIRHVANSLANQYHRLLLADDLVQEGALGLMKAAELYDPAHGTQFLTYAGYWVRKYIRDYLDAETDAETISLTEIEQAGEEAASEPLYASFASPESRLIQSESMTELYHALEAISTRERTYLWYRFGFPDEPQNKTIKDTASHFHLSESRAKSTEAAALDNIRLELPWWYD